MGATGPRHDVEVFEPTPPRPDHAVLDAADPAAADWQELLTPGGCGDPGPSL